MLKLFTIFTIVVVNSQEIDVKKSFIDSKIVSDVIDVAPKQLAEVSYSSGVTVNLGNELTPTQVKDVPQVKWNTEPNILYTLLMIDPDAPSRTKPTFRGNPLFEYIGSGPPKDTGFHRYIFLVFKQNELIATGGVPVTTSRFK